MAVSDTSSDSDKTRGPIYRVIRVLGLFLLLVSFILVLSNLGMAQAEVRNFLDFVNNLGPLGPLLFILVYVLLAVALVPGSLLTLGAGFLFGLVYGTIYVSIASTVGAVMAFLVGRFLARDFVEDLVRKRQQFGRVEEAVSREGWKIVLLTRLSPIFPYNFLNYAYGLTTVRLRDFGLASWVGMIPGTVLYVYIGSLASDVATLGITDRSLVEWGFFGVGLILTLVVTVYVSRIARKGLQDKTSEAKEF